MSGGKLAGGGGWLGRAVHRHVPITAWLPRYTADRAVSDLIAGVTVGLTVMPQGLAYATLAGLEPQYGLYSAFAGCLVYTVFGSCKDITIGPTALMALMTYQQIVGRNPDFAVLLCFLTGCVQLLMGVLHLGVLIDFISIPVTVGFTSATSVIIAVSQVKGLLGMTFTSAGFLDTLHAIFEHRSDARLADTVLGIICIMALLLLRKLKDTKVGGAKPRQCDQLINRALWLLSTSRNALIVIVCSTVAYAWHQRSGGESAFILTGAVRSGLPPLQLPPFSTVVNNRTLGFTEMLTELGSSVILVPVISVLGNVAIAKAFASGESIDATQELLTLGGCNLVGSFVSSMPVTGSFSRSAVNHASGVQTPMGGLYTGLLIVLALDQLTPFFFFIPKASLAAVIICAVIFMIEYEVVKPMWKASKKDLIPTVATFLLCLILGVEYGILVGVGINIALILVPSARPSLSVAKTKTAEGSHYLLVTPGNSLYFPGVDFMRTSVGRVGIREGSSQMPVIVDCKYILGVDYTAAKGIAAMIEDFNKRRQPIIFLNPNETVVNILKCVCLREFIHVYAEEELNYVLQGEGKFANEPVNVMVEMSDLVPHRRKANGSVHHSRECIADHGGNEPLLIPSQGKPAIVTRS